MIDIATIITIVVNVVITTILSILIKRISDSQFNKIVQKQEAEKRDAKELAEFRIKAERAERREDVRNAVNEAVEPINKSLALIQKGSQVGLQYDLTQLAEKYIEQGYCSRHELEEFNRIYEAYHNLGENGVMNERRAKVIELSFKQPKDKEKRQYTKTTPAQKARIKAESDKDKILLG